MRITLFAITVFLWAIWFTVVEIKLGEDYANTAEWNITGWIGIGLIIISAIALFINWIIKVRRLFIQRRSHERRR